MASDKIVYSPDVTVFKFDENYFPQNEHDESTPVYTTDWRKIDVITCAAPFFRSPNFVLPDDDLYHLLRRRIQNMFESAIDHNIEAFEIAFLEFPPTGEYVLSPKTE